MPKRDPDPIGPTVMKERMVQWPRSPVGKFVEGALNVFGHNIGSKPYSADEDNLIYIGVLLSEDNRVLLLNTLRRLAGKGK